MSEFPTVALDFERCEPAQMAARARDFYALMDKRRSVRVFDDTPVDPEILRNAIRTAGTAPSGAHMQPWHFALVTSAEIKSKIRVAAEAEERETYANRMSEEWRRALAPLGTDANKPFLETVPALIVVFRVDYGLDRAGERTKHYYVQESVGIATGMLICALHNAGLATLTHTPSPMNFLQKILERPANERAYLLLPVGYPARDCRVPELARKPLDEICTEL